MSFAAAAATEQDYRCNDNDPHETVVVISKTFA